MCNCMGSKFVSWNGECSEAKNCRFVQLRTTPTLQVGPYKLDSVITLLNELVFSREGNHPDDYSRLTYRKLLEDVCRFANVLKSRGVKRGDRVAVYMPMILESVIVMLACTRIGAVHSLVVGTSFSISPAMILHTMAFVMFCTSTMRAFK